MPALHLFQWCNLPLFMRTIPTAHSKNAESAATLRLTALTLDQLLDLIQVRCLHQTLLQQLPLVLLQCVVSNCLQTHQEATCSLGFDRCSQHAAAGVTRSTRRRRWL